MENGRESVSVPQARGEGYAALPLSALVSLGAEVSPSGDQVRAWLGELEFRFRVGSATFTVDGVERPLAHPVYRDDGVTFLPMQFFVEYLPAFGLPVEVDAGTRTLRRVRRVAAAKPHVEAEERAPESRPAAREEAKPERPAPHARRLVVVDAGHGGVDPGATGPGGTREKTVTLAVARQLAALLRQDPTLEVRMTRDRDTLIALRDRSRFANLWREGERPALFISIHCNANPSPAARGFETYFLSEAKTEDARRVARMENAAQQYEKGGGDDMDPLSFILHDLRQNKYLRDSNDWAAIIQGKLREVGTGGPARGVMQAGFYVLNGTFMPSVLVEIGFITNPREERVLADPDQQRQIAEGLARSIHAFFARGGTSTAEE